MDKKKIGIGIAVLLVVGLIIAAVCIFANGGDTDKTPNKTESSTTTAAMTGGSTTVQNETEPSSDTPSQSMNGPVEDSIFDNDTTAGNATTNASVADTTVKPVNGSTTSTTLGGSTGSTDTTKTTGKVTASTARTTKPVIGTTKPIFGTTKPIIGTTRPIIGTTKPTTVTTKPVIGTTKPTTVTTTTTTTTTKPTTTTTTPATDPDPITYEQYHAMSAKDQRLYMESFTSIDAFFEWYNAAREKYEQDNPSIDVGDGSFDLGDLL